MKRNAGSSPRREDSARGARAPSISPPFRRVALSALAVGIIACSEMYVDPTQHTATPDVDGGVGAASAIPQGPISVVGHHNSAKRSGTYVQPGLSRSAVGSLHVDPLFNAPFKGAVLAQPLFVEDGPHGQGAFYVVTEMNDVTAFDETTGDLLWTKNFGTPADQETTLCTGRGFGFIGITSTPAIDLDSRTMYFDAVTGLAPLTDAGIHYSAGHLVHAISIDDGTEREGWPFDPSRLTSNGHTFDPTVQHQRGALLLSEGMLYVPYASLGDCGAYYGWLVGIPVADPQKASAYAPPGFGSGIWGPGGVAGDMGKIYVATGNGQEPSGPWMGGEAIMRFTAGVPLPSAPEDYYVPANWHDMDLADMDIAGSGVVLIDAPGSSPSELALALGKDGVAYLLDQNNLGKIAGPGSGDGGTGEIAKTQVATKNIITAAATYTLGQRTFVAFDAVSNGVGVSCPAGQAGDLVVLEIVGTPPTIQTLWCANNAGHGAPMITTTDGMNDPIVWVTADTSQRLHAYDALTGELLYSGGGDAETLVGLRRLNTGIAVRNRIIVVTDNGLYAFTN